MLFVADAMLGKLTRWLRLVGLRVVYAPDAGAIEDDDVIKLAAKNNAILLTRDEELAAKVYQGTQPLTAEDIAETAYWIATLPKHVNVNNIELMPVCQSIAGLAIHRES